MKFTSYCQECVLSHDNNYVYQVWYLYVHEFRQKVFYGKDIISVTCMCKMYTEVGILCSHCLHVLNINCVKVIPR